MTRKRNLGLDWDEFLITGLQDAFVDYIVSKCGWTFDPEILACRHSWEEATGRPSSEISAEYARFYRQLMRAHHRAKPVPGSREALTKLQAKFDLHIVTAVTRELQPDLVVLSRRLFPEIEFSSVNCGHRLTKGYAARNLCLAFHVDDIFGELEHILEHSPDTVCVQFPGFYGGHSPAIDHPNMHRLSACDHVQPGIALAERDRIRKEAWRELEEFLLSQVSDAQFAA